MSLVKQEFYYSKRLTWVDWMKTIAMYFIISGHIAGIPFDIYIYTFSVPLFFILSGFLSKKERDTGVFFHKLFYNLLVPMLILSFFNAFLTFIELSIRGAFSIAYLWKLPLSILVGNQGQDLVYGGLGPLWFVYTLVLCKLIFQFSPQKKEVIFLLLVSIMMLGAASFLFEKGIVKYNSFINVLLAFPLFSIGYLCRYLKGRIETINNVALFVIFFIGAIGVWASGTYNDYVYLYCCSFGNNLFLFFTGALCGTMAVFSISKLLKLKGSNFASIVGGGTLLILGMHLWVIRLFSLLFSLIANHYLYYFEAFLVLIFFAPVVLFVKKYIPILYGKYRYSK